MSGVYYPSQHGRTHCPNGSDPIPAACLTSRPPGFHGYKDSALVLSTGNAGQLAWDSWLIDDPTVFEEGTLSGGDLTDFELLLPGWYAISCWAEWSGVAEPTTGFAGIAMIHDDTDISEPRNAQGVTYPMNWPFGAAMKYTDIRYFPTDFTQTQTFGFVNRLEFWVIHNHGSNRTLNNAYVDVAYLGDRPA